MTEPCEVYVSMSRNGHTFARLGAKRGRVFVASPDESLRVPPPLTDGQLRAVGSLLGVPEGEALRLIDPVTDAIVFEVERSEVT